MERAWRWRKSAESSTLPVPIATPAHGTAHDIAGQGIADPTALVAAYRLAAKMAGTAEGGSEP